MNKGNGARRGKVFCFLLMAIGAARVAAAADGTWTNASYGVWSDAGKWVDGTVAGSGGMATFMAPSGTYEVTNDLGTVTLSGFNANTNSADGSGAAEWRIVGGTLELTAPARIYTRANSLSVRQTTLSGSTDLLITGLGRFFLGDDNLYTGRTIISNGNVRVARDSGFGPVPVSLQPDAITLDNGGLENDENTFVLTNAATRGITVTARGGFLGCGYASAGFLVNGPITGPGLLGINFENCPVTLNNPNNDYAGGTVVGTNGPGANTACAPVLKLGQNEVLPHGSGKGGLAIGSDSSFNNTLLTSTLDLNGKTETVNTLTSGPRAQIGSSSGAGELIIGGLDDDSDYRGTLTTGATIEKQGAGTLRLAGAALSGGTVALKAGTVLAGGPNLAAGSTLLFDGGDLTLTAPSGLYEFKGASGTAPDLGAALSFTRWQLWPAKGSTTSAAEFPYNTQYVYRGKWFVADAGTYSFAKGFDDGGYLAIDGMTVISNAATVTRAVVNDVAISAGWHTVEIRFSQGTGTVGPQFGFRNGILYDSGNGGFTNSAELARARMFTDDGGTNLVADGYANVLAGRLSLAQDATLTVGAEAGTLILAGNVTTNVLADPEPVLTVANGGSPLLFGSDSGSPAVLDAAVSCDDGLTLTNRVWLRRLPGGTYAFASGADLALDGAALLGGPLNLDDYSVRIVRDDSVGGDGAVTANGGTAVWFDTARYVDHTLSDSAATAVTYANAVALNGGSAAFTGAGTITYNGVLTGTGNALKTGAGDLLLSASGSTFSGDLRIDAGRVLPADESALRGASVRLNGGRLTNPAGGDLTLDTTPITAADGGFEVTAADETMTVNSPVTGVSPISKWGAGTLVLGGTAINTNLDLYVRAGRIELNKSGAASDYAVRNLLGVSTNLTVTLTGSNGNQIGGNVTLDGGVLDLNGHSETLGVLTNTLTGGIVTNGGATAATLTVGDGGGSSAFDGVLTDGAGALALAKAGAGTMVLSTRAMAYSGGTTVEGGTLRLRLTLPVTAGLVSRLDATDTSKLTLDSSNVTAWADSSTNGVNFAQSTSTKQPVYLPKGINGQPAVQFGYGGSKRMYANKSVTARTVFIVSQVTPYRSLAGVWGSSGNDSGIRQYNTDMSWRHTNHGADGNDFTFNGQMFIDGVAGYSFPDKPAHVLTGVSTSDKVWTCAIGDYWANATYDRYFRGEIGEILVYSRVLSTNERQLVESYLHTKWFGGVTLPASQPLAVDTGARLAVDGFDLTLDTLSGGGGLIPESGNTVALTDYASFTGTVAGTGTVIIRDSAGTAAHFVPQSFDVTVRNDGAQDAVINVGTEGTGFFFGAVQDGSNTLGIVHSGTGTTYFAGLDSTYSGDTVVEHGAAIVGGVVSAKFVRFFPEATRTNGAHINTGYQLSEFQLTLSGAPVSFPAGASATSPGGTWSSAESPAKAIDGSVSTKYYNNSITPLYPLVVSLSQATAFDGYRWYTANDAEGRDPVTWGVDISDDGVNWTRIDHQDYYGNQSAVTMARYALVGTWLLSDVAEMNAFSDISATTVSALGTLGVSGTSETVGALSGDGTLLLLNATLGINAFAEAAFSGGINGTGTVVKTGAEKQSLSGALAYEGELIVDAGVLDLSGATLTGVTNIVIRSGAVLTGAAAVNGDLTVTFEGGVYSASLAVSGALTVNGAVTLGVQEGATYPYDSLLFSYASADAATRSALLDAATPSPVPAGHAAIVRVTDSAARLVISPVGTVLTVQ